MSASSVVKNFSDGSLTILDGSTLTFVIPFDNGDFSADGLKYKRRETVAYQHRGVTSSIRHTSVTYPTFSFTCSMSTLTSATQTSISDAILKNGAWAAAVSTLGATADVYTVDLKITVEGTNFGDAGDPTTTFEDCELSFSFAEGDPNTFSISGTCYGAVVGDLAN